MKNPLYARSEAQRFTIPWVPPGLNRQLRMHWSPRKKLTEIAGIYIASQIGSRPQVEHKVKVTIQMYRYNSLDQDGATGGCKPIFDALVRLGWAKDDSQKWMEQVILPVKIERGKNRHDRTEISIDMQPESD